jgi:hypothetical protein
VTCRRPVSVLAPLVLWTALACTSAPGHAPLVVLIGDSTTAGYGTGAGYQLADRPPLASLAALLPAESPWRTMEVVALAVPSSTSHDWAVGYERCKTSTTMPEHLPSWTILALRACRDGSPLVDHVAAVVGRPIDAALVVLGTNDHYRHHDATVDETVRNLETIAARLAPSRVLVASPFWTPEASRHAFVEALAARLAARGLLTGPDFARQRLPVDRFQVHLTRGGFVAAAALWLDALERVTPGAEPPVPQP